MLSFGGGVGVLDAGAVVLMMMMPQHPHVDRSIDVNQGEDWLGSTKADISCVLMHDSYILPSSGITFVQMDKNGCI